MAPANTLVNRIAMSPPSWNKYNNFERQAWIVLNDSANVQEVLKILRDKGEIAIPGPIDPATGDVNLALYQFSPSYGVHISRSTNFSNHSSSVRVQQDELCARMLANYLDLERGIPESQQLHHLLTRVLEPHTTVSQAAEDKDKSVGVAAGTEVVGEGGSATSTAPAAGAEKGALAVIQPTDILDITIAYLRRVHFVCYYEGRRFPEEGLLLAHNSNIARREKEYYIHRSVLPEGPVDVGVKRKRAESETPGVGEAAGGGTGMEVDPPGATEGAEFPSIIVRGVGHSAPSRHPTLPDLTVKTLEPISRVDRKVFQLVADVHGKLYNRGVRNAYSDDPKGIPEEVGVDKDEEDVAAIGEELERALSVWADGLVRLETGVPGAVGAGEGAGCKARCGYSWCNKLFKGPEFVRKHVRSKHAELSLDVVTRVIRPYAWARFEVEGLRGHPFSVIAVEGSKGYGMEYRTVGEILDRIAQRNMPRAPVTPVEREPRERSQGQGDREWEAPRRSAHAYDHPGHSPHSGPGGYGSRDRDRGGDHGVKHTVYNDHHSGRPDQQEKRAFIPHTAPAVVVPPPNPSNRPLQSFVDVDAPQVCICAYLYYFS